MDELVSLGQILFGSRRPRETRHVFLGSQGFRKKYADKYFGVGWVPKAERSDAHILLSSLGKCIRYKCSLHEAEGKESGLITFDEPIQGKVNPGQNWFGSTRSSETRQIFC